MMSFNLNYCIKILFPNMVTLGVGTSTYKFFFSIYKFYRETNNSAAEVNRRYEMVKLSSILFREMVGNIRNS